ncbi:LacI family DNA-binding transcriptional regulator [Mammaliicoccus fleurettii]|uniref:LacI family DNA-binding transcriptional regulator n=1 Tax=Mammaliicoccus fleurettii TaxID=150056 RepID=UPI002DBA567A|nr:LacI family DNA-binding transcriptional regulator [Mammaliicoccus fleurettii]MEB7724125.1 LacI family transcriptional regulator [Mammaliicoccus fleurettii]MEB7779848.1 LacI family transcriptional regulator [Mammaliicoccus fleurettii]MEB8068104.1 LacI family transcriptional regulator [Mammaliicoccus fleurettii]
MATIKDVAKHAGLSVTTVSRYLNHHPYISEEKKEKIKVAMKELDYTPNSAATQLRSNRSFTIGVIVSRITNPYFAYLIDAIEKEVKKTNYHLLIMQTYDDKSEELRLLDMLKQKHIDGIIMASIENELNVIEQYNQYGPIVLTGDKSLNDSYLPVVSTDQEKATYNAIQFLINKGYHKIAYCTGGAFDNTKHGSSRNKGFIKALEDNDISVNMEWVYKNIHTIDDGFNVAKNIMTLPRESWPRAIFSGSDEVAAGMVKCFLENDVDIPKEIAIIGYDNQPLSEMLSIPLTTVSQPIEAIGFESTNLLMSSLNEEKYVVNQETLELNIIDRKST